MSLVTVTSDDLGDFGDNGDDQDELVLVTFVRVCTLVRKKTLRTRIGLMLHQTTSKRHRLAQLFVLCDTCNTPQHTK